MSSAPDSNSTDMTAVYAMMRRPMVCVCRQVSEEELHAAIAQGARSMDDLMQQTECCTGCGTCYSSVEKILKEKVET